MDLGEVVERGTLLGVGERVGAAVVVDRDVALLDVDVGRAVLQGSGAAVSLELPSTSSVHQPYHALPNHIITKGM